ncbi:MAG: UDP-N-acetylmuramoyl-L-alanyl-D-glutamate--2,6-diaminopimelate ligase [Candidatus Borkfalkiaceae bacterium]|nr:UDP-N-acetylmuramoyl-L-alanyl-D-glutamate--2,6-diaminopimelate ligase [Clostridia bacterium]MDY6223416.1 UDP-N-acetylmuramoyl-L-alanyl-D-glutamate--2,6-diaminopimelate ligase [Christensenellaceae bacterium]
MRLKDLIKCTGGALLAGKNDSEKDITGVSCDGRYVKRGEAFFCLTGGNLDGRQFAAQAAERGAGAIVTPTPLTLADTFAAPPQIVVSDTRKAFALAAGAYYGNPAEKMRVAGVTGTNGKTTVTYLLSSIFDCAGKTSGVIGTTGIFYAGRKIDPALTTPDPAFLHKVFYDMKKTGVTDVCMEVSAHALHYEKTAGIPFAARIFTNFSQDHLDFFGSMSAYKKTKEKFFFSECEKSVENEGGNKGGNETAKQTETAGEPQSENVKKGGVFVINADDETGRNIAKRAQKNGEKVITYGLENPSDVFAVITDESVAGSKFLLNLSDRLCRVNLSLTGRHNVYNALAAASCAFALGVDSVAIAEGLKTARLPRGRLQRVRGVSGAEIFIDYAHTPDGLEKSLSALRPFCKGKLYCLFGCGGNRDRGKRAQMGAIAAKMADFSYLTSDNPRYEDPADILREIESGHRRFSENYVAMSDRKKAIFYAVNFLKKGDILLIAGKGGEETQEIMGIKYEYDDETAVREAIAAKIAGEKG